MIKIYRNTKSKQLVIYGVSNNPIENYSYIQNGDDFIIYQPLVESKPDIVRTSYSKFVDKLNNSFASANDFKNYLDTILDISIYDFEGYKPTVLPGSLSIGSKSTNTTFQQKFFGRFMDAIANISIVGQQDIRGFQQLLSVKILMKLQLKYLLIL